MVRPIFTITEHCRPLYEGHLELDLHYTSKNELGALAKNLEQSMDRVHGYVEDINHIMAQLSPGNLNVSTCCDYIGGLPLH